MDQSAGAALRWGRSTVLALVALVTGAAAHVGADGLLPGWPVLLMMVVVAAVACQPFLARPASTARVVALTVGAQTLVHGALSVTAGHRGEHHVPVQPLPPVTLGQTGSPTDLAAAGTPTGPSLVDSLALLTADLPMVLLHLVAAAVVGLWLARGERALWTLLTLVWRFVALPLPAPGVTPLRPVAVRRVPPPAPRLRLLARAVTRRGPPALRAA